MQGNGDIMPTRKRIRTIIRQTSGGGGGGPAPGGTISWGPSFGQSAGNDDSTWNVSPTQRLSKLGLRGAQTATGATAMPSLALVGAQSTAATQNGSVLGAPFWQSVETSTGESVTSLAVNKPSGVVAGDLLVFVLGRKIITGSWVPTPPPGLTSIRADTIPTPSIGVLTYYKVATTSEPSQYTFTFSTSSANNITLECHRIIGVNASTPINASAGATLAATSLDPDPDSPSVTTTVANCLVMTVLIHDHAALSNSHSLPSGHEEVSDFESTAGASLLASNTGWRVFASVGATGPIEHNCTETVATNAVMQRIAIAPGTVVIA